MSDNTENQILTLMVGSYSDSTETALRTYAFDAEDGSSEFICPVPVANASYFIQAPSGLIYVVGEGDEAGSMITAVRPSGQYANPEVINSQLVGSSAPCYVAVTPDGKYVVTANYNGGNASVFPLADDGSVRPRCELLEFVGNGPVESRQDKSHPHCISFTPDGKYMLVNDLGTDQIHQFSINSDSISPVRSVSDKDIEIKPGSGPRHIVFNQAGEMAYLINEIADAVTVLKYDGQNLEPVQYIQADTANAQGAGDIHLSGDGKYLYASLRLKHDGIATFKVDPATGLLTHIGHTTTLRHPRNFTFSPDGRYMLVASRDDNAVQIFAVDKETGALTDTGNRIDVPKPVCVKFINPEAR